MSIYFTRELFQGGGGSDSNIPVYLQYILIFRKYLIFVKFRFSRSILASVELEFRMQNYLRKFKLIFF